MLLSIVLVAALLPVAFAASQRDHDDCDQTRDRDRQIEGCTRIIDDRGERADIRSLAYVQRGNARAAKREFERAIVDYNEATKLRPNDANIYLVRAITLAEQKEHVRAIVDYDRSIKLDSKYAESYYWRGNSWRALGEVKRAIADYGMAIKLDAKHANAYFNRGNVWRTMGDNKSAIADLTKAFELGHRRARDELDKLRAASQQ